jgi:hypothetical protein
MGVRITSMACPACPRTRNPYYPCPQCGGPAIYAQVMTGGFSHPEQRAWRVWCGTWWKPWTWFRFGWIELDVVE